MTLSCPPCEGTPLVNSSPRQPDTRSPWLLDIHELVRRPGEMKELRTQLPAPVGLGTELIGVSEGSPVDLELRLESVGEGVLVTGVASATVKGECARCLTTVEDHLNFDVEELYYYPGREAEEDAYWVQNDQIDLEPALRDAVVLELPFTPLCRPDCSGLCLVCGADLNADPEHGHGATIDPRWQKLAGLAPEGQSD